MASRRDAIIAELIALDPSLASKREELAHVLDSLEAARPRTEPTRSFERALLKRLRGAMRETEEASAPPYFLSFFSLMFNRSLFAGGGALLGALLVFVAMQQRGPVTSSTDFYGEGDMPEAGITDAGPRAFGSISVDQQAAGGRGGGGGGGAPSIDTMSANDAKLIYPAEDYTVTRFTYDGVLPLSTDDVEVYRHVPPGSRPSAAGIGKGFAEQMINWGAFGNLQTQSLQLTETGRNPYHVSVDFNEGSLSIHRSFDASSRPDLNCTDTDCWERNRLRENDMIPDAEAIRIARDFANRFGLDLSRYGEPQVMDEWRTWYELTEDKASYYFPEQLTVVFPLLIDGKPVYEEYGSAFGVNVGIDVRTKEASGLYNYYFHAYEKSAYAPLGDEQKARQVLEQGSMYLWDDPNATKVYSTLGEPTEGFMRTYQWDQATMTNRDLIVPALVFPVTERHPDANDGRTRVLLPLAEDVLPENTPQPVPLPRPLYDPAASEEPLILE